MAVEKVTIQQAAGDLLKGTTSETTADNNSFNNTKINPFLFDEKTLEQAQKAKVTDGQYSTNNTKGLLFGSKIVEEPKAKKAESEVPNNNRASLGVLSNLTNFIKNVKYGINQYDVAVTPNVKQALGEIPNESDITAAIMANRRIDAILIQAGLI